MSENITIKLQNVRISYPHLFKAVGFKGDTEKVKFSTAFILDKKANATEIKALRDAIAKLTTGTFKGKNLPPDKVCIKEGSDMGDSEGYSDKVMYINASSLKRPVVVNRDLSALVAEDNKPYAGCYVNGVISLWAQDNSWGKRINASLTHVQFLKDGPPLGEKVASAEEVFSAIEDDDAV